MNGETKLGLGLAGLLALCCAGPLILSLLASGAVLGVLSALRADGRPLLLAAGALLIIVGAWVLARRRVRSAAGPSCVIPVTKAINSGPANPGDGRSTPSD